MLTKGKLICKYQMTVEFSKWASIFLGFEMQMSKEKSWNFWMDRVLCLWQERHLYMKLAQNNFEKKKSLSSALWRKCLASGAPTTFFQWWGFRLLVFISWSEGRRERPLVRNSLLLVSKKPLSLGYDLWVLPQQLLRLSNFNALPLLQREIEWAGEGCMEGQISLFFVCYALHTVLHIESTRELLTEI